jgi:hypothetical protein
MVSYFVLSYTLILSKDVEEAPKSFGSNFTQSAHQFVRDLYSLPP